MSKLGVVLVATTLIAVAPKVYNSALSLADFKRAEALIAEAIEKRRTVIELQDLENLTSIPTSVRQISGLWYVRVSGTKVDNVEPLTGLPDLRNIQMANTRVTDLSPLSQNTRLEVLDIGRSWVYDLEPLQNLPRLKWLQMDRVAVKSLCPLKRVRSLNWLNLYSSYAEDGSHDCFNKLKTRVKDLGGGNSYKQNYIPGSQYKAQIHMKRLLREWEWR